MSVVGYTRVSTQDQNLDSQIDALARAGAQHVYSDKATGKNVARPGLVECMKFLREHDTLLVYSTDRLGRSMTDVVTIVETLRQRGVEFKSLTESFDTTTPGGELFFHICAALPWDTRTSLVQSGSSKQLHSASEVLAMSGRPDQTTSLGTTSSLLTRAPLHNSSRSLRVLEARRRSGCIGRFTLRLVTLGCADTPKKVGSWRPVAKGPSLLRLACSLGGWP